MERYDSDCCEHCRFFNAIAKDGGQCLRYPPTVLMQAAMDGSGNVLWENAQPWVAKTDWCGEWKGSST